MSTFFHVDRNCTINSEIDISLTIFEDIRPHKLQTHVDFLFPDGVSTHGDTYFLKSNASPNLPSPDIEVFFEYVRRAYFPEKPSRFQSLFAVTNLDDAINFKETFGNPENKIWAIEATTFHKADMNLLKRNCSILVYSYFAHVYWSGDPGPETPFWEVLIPPPIKILAEVED